jgi:hypothetical protein
MKLEVEKGKAPSIPKNKANLSSMFSASQFREQGHDVSNLGG